MMGVLLRCIEGWHVDDEGDWVAELECLHGQHVRHDPPWQERAWVHDQAERTERVGTTLECPLCDRAELPDGLAVVRTTPAFDLHTVPAGLLRAHQVATGVWGRLRVLDGSLRFRFETDDGPGRELTSGDRQAIPPSMPHRVELSAPVRFEIDFLSPRS